MEDDRGYFHRVTGQTPTRLWINNPTREEADLAIRAGAISCTTNPTYAMKMIQREKGDYALNIVADCVKKYSDDGEAADHVQQMLVEGIRSGRVLAAHDISHGGLLVTVSEMMLRSAPAAVGCSLSFAAHDFIRAASAHALFSEYGGIVIEVAAAVWDEFQEQARSGGVPVEEIGRTTAEKKLGIQLADETVEVDFDDIAAACAGKCHQLFG